MHLIHYCFDTYKNQIYRSHSGLAFSSVNTEWIPEGEKAQVNVSNRCLQQNQVVCLAVLKQIS